MRWHQVLYLEIIKSDPEADDSSTVTALTNLSVVLQLFICEPHVTIKSWNVQVKHVLQNLKGKWEATSVKQWSQSRFDPKFASNSESTPFSLCSWLVLLLLLPAISWLFHYCIPGSLSTFFNLSLVYVSYTFKTFFQHHSFPQTFTSFSFSSHLPLALLMMCSSGLTFTVVSQHFQKLITFLLRCSWCKIKHQWDVMPADITGDWNPKEGRLSFIYLFKHFASGNTEE